MPGQHRVTYVVKRVPRGTDATTEDARFAGIEDIADVVSTEARQPLRIVSSRVKALAQAVDSVDIIISRGMLNYELLARQFKQPAFYLFRAKCRNIIRSLVTKGDFEIGDVVLIKNISAMEGKGGW